MPKFSVCIPTRDRHHTLPYAVASVLAQTHTDLELIVQDNFSSDETYNSLKGISDPRLKYCRSDRRLSMHANWEAALDETRGDYITFIGDDDALLPYCLERVNEILAIGDVELLAWLAHTYYWPDVPDAPRRNHLSLDLRGGTVWANYISPEARTMDRARHRSFLPPGVMALDAKEILKNWLRHDGARIYAPTYHNLVSREVVNRVKEASGGTYFFNPLPDFGTLIANLYVSRELLFYTAPLSMTGHSRSSSGGTHGHQESWERRLAKFIEESGWTAEQLLPSVFRPFLWGPALLAGCFEDVKRRLFPDDKRFEVHWGNFLISAAAGVNGEPESVRGACKEWLFESADRIGLPRRRLQFPDVPGYTREKGTLIDPDGRAVYIFVDGDAFGLETVTDAVNIACALHPTRLYPIAFAPAWVQSVVAVSNEHPSSAQNEGPSLSERARQIPAKIAGYRHETLKRALRGSVRVARNWNIYNAARQLCPASLKRAFRLILSS